MGVTPSIAKSPLMNGSTRGRASSVVRFGFAAGLMVASLQGCSRNNIEAVNMANEGDQLKATNLDEAISKFEQATTLDPTNHRIWYKLILAYQKKEDWAKVAQAATKVEKLAPTYANYYFIHGHALMKQAEKGPTSWSDAKEPLTQAVSKDPNLADAYFDLAEIALRTDDEAGALQYYTKAISTKPDEIAFYVPLADLYRRLGFQAESEKVAKEGVSFAKEGDKALFALHSLLGEFEETKGNVPGAITQYEAAKKACGNCMESARGEQIAYFNLGSAYASANPPRKNEAIQQLTSFSKMVCKGGLAARFADQCAQAQEIAKRLGGTLP